MFIVTAFDLPLGNNAGSHFEPIGLFDPTIQTYYNRKCASEGCYQKPDPAHESVKIDQDRFTPAWTFGFT